MAFNYENMIQAYNKLEPGNSNAWEIYAGERSQAMAEEQDIPQSKWMADRMTMQLGQEVMDQELAKEIPYSPEEWDARLRDMVSRQVGRLLRSESNDMARKGLLFQILRNNAVLEAAEAGVKVSEEEVEVIHRLSLLEMQDAVVELGMKWTKQRVLPILHQQCGLLNQPPEQLKELLKNPGALAVAGYLGIPELRNAPETVGAAAEAASHFQKNTGITSEDVFYYIAIALLALAVGITIIALVSLSSAWLTAGATHLLVEGTLTGITAAISQEMTFIGGFVLSMLKVALGNAVVGGLSALMGKLFHTEPNHQPTESVPAVSSTGHSHRVKS